MRHVIGGFILFMACLAAHGQAAVFFSQNYNTQTATVSSFSPAAGAVSNPTTVTANVTSGCASYTHFDTSNPPTTQQDTYSVTTAVTLYAQVRGCPGYNNSTTASASYTITVPQIAALHVSTLVNYTGSGASAQTITATSPGSVLLIVTFSQDNDDLTTITGGGGSYSKISKQRNVNGISLGVYCGTGVSTGTTSVSVTPSGYDVIATVVVELSNATCTLDGSVSTLLISPSGTNSSGACGSVITSVANSGVFCVVGIGNHTTTISADTTDGYSFVFSAQATAAATLGLQLHGLAAGTYNPNWYVSPAQAYVSSYTFALEHQ